MHSRQQKTHNTENQIFYKDLENIVFQIISELSPRAQLIFKMNRLEGMTNQEISTELNISKKTVENQMHTALKHIRVQLTERSDLKLVTTLSILLKFF